MFVNFNILNQLGSPAINSNTFANRPAAGQTGRLFVSTDTFEIYRDNGTTWDLIGGPGSSTITGSGTVGTIPLWTSTSAIGDSDLRQLSSQALILNSATNDWPTSQIVNEAGRILLTSVTNNPTLICWGKNAFGSGNEQGTIVLGNVTALGTTTIGGAFIDGFIENNTDGAGSFQIRTTNTSGNPATALTINSSQISTFTNNVIVNSPGSIGIRTATPGAALDVHSTGTIAQFNTTAATGNVFLAIQRSGTGLWRIGDTYNGGSNFFELHNTTLASNAIQVQASSNEATFSSTKTYSTGNSIGVAVQHNLTIPNAVNVGLAALGGVNSNLNLTLGGSTTVANTGRQGLEGSTTINFTGAGTLTMTQGTTVRAFSALSSVYAFNGSAVGTITHLAGLRICFPDNVGSAVNITNNYALLINNQTTGTGTVTYTNRWGIYQEGASDLNYMAANLLLGSTTNNGNKLQVTGNLNVTGNGAFGQSVESVVRLVASSADNTNGTIALAARNQTGTAAFFVYGDLSTYLAGPVGIGTNAPARPLSVLSYTDDGSINSGGNLYSSGYFGNGGIVIGTVSTNGNAAIFNNSAKDILFGAWNGSTNAEYLRIKTGGNVLIGTTTDAGQKLQVNGTTRSTQFQNDDGTLNIANNVATTIYTPSGARGLYLLYLSLPAGDSAPANYSAYAIFSWDTASAIILQQTDAANLFITLNGNNIQARQVSGAANDVTWRVIKIG
jgi:hypothetical protein